MPNRWRYRLHAMPELARAFGTESEPMRALTEREVLSRKPLPAPPTSLARVPVARCVSATDVRAAVAAQPSMVPAYLALIQTYERLGHPGLALQVARAGTSALPSSLELRERLEQLERP